MKFLLCASAVSAVSAGTSPSPPEGHGRLQNMSSQTVVLPNLFDKSCSPVRPAGTPAPTAEACGLRAAEKRRSTSPNRFVAVLLTNRDDKRRNLPRVLVYRHCQCDVVVTCRGVPGHGSAAAANARPMAQQVRRSRTDEYAAARGDLWGCRFRNSLRKPWSWPASKPGITPGVSPLVVLLGLGRLLGRRSPSWRTSAAESGPSRRLRWHGRRCGRDFRSAATPDPAPAPGRDGPRARPRRQAVVHDPGHVGSRRSVHSRCGTSER